MIGAIYETHISKPTVGPEDALQSSRHRKFYNNLS